MMGLALVLLVIGIGHVAVPRVSWFLSIGWKLKNASPSAAFMLVSRVGGAVLSVIGMAIIVSATFQAVRHSGVAAASWRQFQRQMTVQNIQSIRAGGTQPLPAAAIPVLVSDIHTVASFVPYVASGTSFSATAWWLVTCRSGYRVSVIDVNGQGAFGIARGANWLVPTYQFTSNRLLNWERAW